MDGARQHGEPELDPIDWWVWHLRNTGLMVVVTADTMLRAKLEGVSKIRGAVGVWDVDAEVRREGDTRATQLAKLKKAA